LIFPSLHVFLMYLPVCPCIGQAGVKTHQQHTVVGHIQSSSSSSSSSGSSGEEG
jgi:hypothetical protein